MSNLVIENNTIELGNYTIKLGNNINNRIRLYDDTGKGKSRFVEFLRTGNYENLFIVNDIDLSLNYFETLNRIYDTTGVKQVVIIDDCALNIGRFKDNKLENAIKRFIINDDKRFYILISRNILVFGTPVYNYNNISENEVVIEESISLTEFQNKFKRELKIKPTKLVCEDTKSGKQYFEDTTGLTAESYKEFKGEKGGVLDAVNKANSLSEPVWLCVDYISDNPIVLDVLRKYKPSDNVRLLCTHCVEEIVYQVYKEGFKNNIPIKWFNTIEEEIKFKNHIHSICKGLLNKYYGSCNTFEQLMYQILHTLTGYSKNDLMDTKIINIDTNILFLEIQNKLDEITIDDNEQTSYFN